MKFKSKRDNLFSLVILGINSFLFGITAFAILKGKIQLVEYCTLCIILGVVFLLFWLYYGTSYRLSKNGLIYKSGPFHRKISIDRITEITKGKTLWMGYRPATSRKGLIIKYDKYNEIYISPQTNESFIDEILKLKNDIKITE